MNTAEEPNVIPMPINEPNPALAQSVMPIAASQDAGGVNNLEKIRDILFGSHIRDYERRFVRLEERLVKETADTREDTRRRFDALESYIKQEIAALGDRLRSENQQRAQSTEELTRELRDLARSLGQKINQLDEQTAQANRDLREQLLAQSKDLANEIRQKHDDVSATISREARDLRHDKTDRSALANLFTELAMRLNHEFKLPGNE